MNHLFFQNEPHTCSRIPKIKLCGLTRLEDIKTVNELMPEFVGFVFAKKSRRYLSPSDAKLLRKHLKPGILPVGVFVNEDPKQIAALLASGTISVVQLHGSEDEAYLSALRQLTDCPLLKAFRIDGKEDVLRASACSADGILVDSGTGGTGTTFDWSLLKDLSRPFFLAGGLTLSNTRRAIDSVSPFAVDISSGIETNGKKDPDKMRKFVRLVREPDGKDIL